MRQRPVVRWIAAALLCIGVTVTGTALARHKGKTVTTPLPVSSLAPYDPQKIYATLRFWEGKVKSDPQSALSLNHLAGTYLQAGRETGDLAMTVRGEMAARRSLKIRVNRNETARSLLALSLLTQHRFPEAMHEAKAALKADPESDQARQLCAEIALELGDYTEAERYQKTGVQAKEDRYSRTLTARMLEINGHPESALRLYRAAQEEADHDYDLSRENAAWFHLRVGDCLLGMGRMEEAEKSYLEALSIFPDDYKALSGLCRLAAYRNDWAKAVEWGEKAVRIVPNPEIVALLGDAYTALGKTDEAKRQWALIEMIGKLSQTQGNVYDRQRVLYCADHRVHLKDALLMARQELKIRQDIYGYDALAWVLCRMGRYHEAQEAMHRAMARNTQDARLFYHSGVIDYNLGNLDQAKASLHRSLEINPTFHTTGPSEARALLSKLEGQQLAERKGQ